MLAFMLHGILLWRLRPESEATVSTDIQACLLLLVVAGGARVLEPYRAKAMCRWDKPTFAMVFASITRSLRLLQSAKMAFGSQKCENTLKKDLGIIAKATAADFERARAVLRHRCLHFWTCTRDTSLKHLLMSTATVPLTEGHKMATRHFGFALSSHFGPLKLLYTANFADTYSPITVALYDGELSGVAVEHARFLGRATVKLFENTPQMPKPRDMHRIVAAHSTIQARLFLRTPSLADGRSTLCRIPGRHDALLTKTTTHPTASLDSRTLPPPCFHLWTRRGAASRTDTRR